MKSPKSMIFQKNVRWRSNSLFQVQKTGKSKTNPGKTFSPDKLAGN